MVEEEDHESEQKESERSGDESEDEEPRIKDVLSHLSRAVPEKRASDLMHSMAAPKDNLLWTPQRTITSKQMHYSRHKHRRAS